MKLGVAPGSAQRSDLVALRTKPFSAVVLSRERKSHFVEPFWKPGEKPPGVLCCQFYEAKWSNGCLFACDYCYLKGTFRWQNWHGREQTVFSNLDQLLLEVEDFLRLEKPSILHTGEVADSLAVPGSEELMARLVERFGNQAKHTLLLLTKSKNVDALLECDHNGRTVVGFSINPRKIAAAFEFGAATTDERLEAADKCIRAGYPVLVRVDPMIPVKRWRQQYGALFRRLNRMNLFGVVVGTLRAFPGLRPMMSRRLQAMLTERDLDRRWHIEKTLRWQMYRFAFQSLRFRRMGLCKETGETWGWLVSEFRDKRFVCNCNLTR